MLISAALIWGAAFVAQSVGMEYVGPFTFNFSRTLIGGLTLVAYIFLTRKKASPPASGLYTKDLFAGGIASGIVLAAASSFQQYGLMFSSVGKAGFITTLYIVIVPILGIFFGKKVSPLIWLSVFLAMFGMYMLCMTESLTVGKGDILLLIGAFFFSAHIMVIDHFSPKADCVRMSCMQFFVCSAICAVPSFIFENPEIKNIISAWLPVLYAGVFSCGVAYTLQIAAQKHSNVVVASLLLSLESVFSAIFGWLLLNEVLSAREISGCILVFLAVLLTNLPGYLEVKRAQKIQKAGF